MISIWFAFILLFVYGLCQYLIALWGESQSKTAKKVKSSATTYTLSLAVYCTSWTYYGNINQASSQGFHHIALFLGSSLVFILFTPLLKKMVRIKQAYHSTSIADFISTRYFNSQYLAALVSLLCLVGITPYISIQLKSIITTFNLLISSNAPQQSFLISQLDIIIVLLMTLFTIVFGVRRLDPTERHPGMMVALAAESLFKLLALLISGFIICFILFNGFTDIIDTVNHRIEFDPRFVVFSQTPAVSAWFASMFLGVIGVIALPRQFHVGIVECGDEKLLDRAKWMFPLYLLLINMMVLPIAMAGLLLLPEGSRGDLTLLQMPVLQQQAGIAAMVFLGGFAASTGMIMVSAMTLSTMATNHLVVPLIEMTPRLRFLRRYLLYIRWVIVTAILFLSLFYYRVIGDSDVMVKIGAISFVAMAQLLPAMIGGLAWKKGNLYGAMAGLIGGSIIWLYTSMLPSVIRSGWFKSDLLSEGPFGISWLKPDQLLGLDITSNIGHSLFWSLLVNITLYILVSEWRKITDKEQLDHTSKFLSIADGRKSDALKSPNLLANIDINDKYQLLLLFLKRYLADDKAEQKLALCWYRCGFNHDEPINILQLSQLRTTITNMLAGLIGMAAANRAIKSISLMSDYEHKLLADCYTDLLAKSQVSPDELLEKVDFYQEKQQLLENHAHLQDNAITELKREKEETLQAQNALKGLNEELEMRVTNRTKELTTANNELTHAMSELTNTQKQLVEADKMASLGALVAGVAHEINTPVGVVLTAITSLDREQKKLAALFKQSKLSKQDMDRFFAHTNESVDISLRNIDRATNLIDSFKQVAVDQTSEKCRLFNVSDYIDNILLSLKPRLRQTNQQIHVECDSNLTIKSYPGALSQMLTNLIINSVVHGFEGKGFEGKGFEGKGLADKTQGNIYIAAKLKHQMLYLDYRDDGKGLCDNGLGNIFEPFYTTKRGAGGSGLGAHIIYNIVTQQLGGEISIDEKLSQGLGFNIHFPVTGAGGS